MKQKLLWIAFGFIWGCSVDPRQGNQTLSPLPTEMQRSGEMISGNAEGVPIDFDPSPDAIRVQVAAASELERGSAGELSDQEASHSTGADPDRESQANGDTPTTAAVPAPTVPVASEADESSVSPPQKVTGAYLYGSLLPRPAGESLKIGLIAKKDGERIGDDPALKVKTWSLTTTLEEKANVKLSKSTDAAYDQILEFYGTDEEFLAVQNSISVQVAIVDKSNTIGLESLVMSTLAELLVPLD